MSWNEANRTCAQKSMSLPVIKSFEDLDMLFDFIRVHGLCPDWTREHHTRLFVFLYKSTETVCIVLAIIMLVYFRLIGCWNSRHTHQWISQQSVLIEQWFNFLNALHLLVRNSFVTSDYAYIEKVVFCNFWRLKLPLPLYSPLGE